jgi:hypothetical protein
MDKFRNALNRILYLKPRSMQEPPKPRKYQDKIQVSNNGRFLPLLL